MRRRCLRRAFLRSVRPCFSRSRILANTKACRARCVVLNAAHSALRRRNSRSASAEYDPCFHRARLLRASPSAVRGPVLFPPCSRQRRFPRTAGPWQGGPRRVRAPHRGADCRFPDGLSCRSRPRRWFAFTNLSPRGSWGCISRYHVHVAIYSKIQPVPFGLPAPGRRPPWPVDFDFKISRYARGSHPLVKTLEIDIVRVARAREPSWVLAFRGSWAFLGAVARR